MAHVFGLTTSAWVLATLAGTASVTAAEPSLKDVLRRMSGYVQTYGEKASIVVATERYTQRVKRSGQTEPQERVTVADFAIVRATGLGGWVGFRDVLEADGTRIADHSDRLLKVLSDAAGTWDEARRLSDESARYNIGPIARNFNVPTAALFFFSPDSLDRFKLTRTRVDPDGTWEIAFRETSRPTLIRTPYGQSVPSEGSVWVNASNGTVLRTRISVKGVGRGIGTAQVDVSYTRVPGIDMWLPDIMIESYQTPRGVPLGRITTEAKYSDYRVFQTSGRVK